MMTRHVVFLTVCTLRIRVLVEHKGDCEPSCIKDTPFFLWKDVHKNVDMM